MPYLFQKRGIRVIYKGSIFVQKSIAVNPQRICKCHRYIVLNGVSVILIQNQCRGHNANLFCQFPCGETLECPVILQILARCGAFFIGFVVKGQMNHDFAFRIEVNPCVIEITIGKANVLNKDNYKDFTGVEAAVKAVVRDKNITEQTEVDAMAKAIEDAIAALQYKDADYTKVDAAIAKANALNKDNYKDFTGVEAAVNAVVRGKNITEQSEVDAMAKAIEDAIAALQYTDADYTKVDAAIAKANALKKDDYKDFSGVETAVKAVVRGKNITEQSEVDKMAKAIEDAIAALEKKPASTKPGTSDKSPQTGDTSNLALWISLLFVSGGAAIGTTVVSRKKKYNR